MKTIILAAALAAASIGMSGCAGMSNVLGGGDSTAILKEVNQHIETCKRTYTGGTGVGASFTFNIECPAQPAAAPVAAPSATLPVVGNP